MKSVSCPWFAAALVGMIAAVSPPRATAQFTWNNSAGGSWNDSTNWTPNGVPNAAGAAATFGSVATTSVNITLASDVLAGAITFDAVPAAGAYNIGSSGRTITLVSATGVAGTQITVNSNALGLVNPQRFVAGQTLQVADLGGLTVTNNGLTLLEFSGLVTLLNNGPLVVTGTGSRGVQFDAETLSGAGPLTKSGSTLLVLSGTQSGFTGTTTITGGVVAIDTATSLGADPAAFGANQLALNGGTLRDTATTAVALAANRGVQIGASGGTFDVSASAGSLRVNGAVSGSGPITKIGPGTLILAGGNGVYSGAVAVNAGALQLAAPSALGNNGAAAITVADGAELQLSGGITTFNSYSLNVRGVGAAGVGAFRNVAGSSTWTGPVTLAANALFNTANNATPLTLRGGVNLNGNQLTLGNASTTGANSSTFTIGTTGLSGTGSLILDPGFTGGVTIPAASPTFTGPTTIRSGTINLQNSLALGPGDGTANTGISVAADAVLQLSNDSLSENPGPVTVGNKPLTLTGGFFTNTNGALQGQGPGNSYAGAITLTAPTTIGAFNLFNPGALTLTGGISAGSNTLTLTADSTSTVTVATAGITGTAGLTKTGTGTAQLAVASTYGGLTTVSAGRLLVTNTTGSATGTSAVTVASGGTLAGTGQIAPAAGSGVTVQGGGVLSPGNGPALGTLTLTVTGGGTVSLQANAIHDFFVSTPGPGGVAANSGGSSTGSNNNLLNAVGTLSIDPGTQFRINGNAAAFTIGQPYSYLIATATGLAQPVNITNPANFNTSNFANFVGGTFSVMSAGTNVYLNFTPVPEPTGLLLACAAAGGAGAAARRYRRTRAKR